MQKIIATLFISICFVGCSVVPLGIEPSSELLKDEQGNNRSYNILGTVQGSDGYFSLFAIIPFGSISINNTFQEITKNNGGDALINIRYWHRSSFYLIGTYDSFEVKADVIKFVQ